MSSYIRDRILGVVRVSSLKQMDALERQTEAVRHMCARLAEAMQEEGVQHVDVQIIKVCCSGFRDERLYTQLEGFFPSDRALQQPHCTGAALGFAVRAMVLYDWDRLTRNEDTFRDMCDRWFHRLGVQIVLAGSPQALRERLDARRALWPTIGLPSDPISHYNPCTDLDGSVFRSITAILRAAHLESAAKQIGFAQYAYT